MVKMHALFKYSLFCNDYLSGLATDELCIFRCADFLHTFLIAQTLSPDKTKNGIDPQNIDQKSNEWGVDSQWGCCI